MRKTPDFDNISVTDLYDDLTIADGTVWYLDYFYHAGYLLSGMKVIHKSLVQLWEGCEKDVDKHRSEMGLFFTLIFLTTQIIENLIKARSLYDLKINNKLEEFSTLKIVIDNYWKCNGHNMSGIIKASKISITEHEKKLINNIEPFMVWGGRYPHPFTRNEYVKNAQNNLNPGFYADSIGILDGMYKRFVGEMKVIHS